MLVLAIDTSMASCSACLYDSAAREVLGAEHQLMERGHAEALPVMVEGLMKQAEKSFKDLGRIAVTIGPGSFTGIRVGISFANGLGQALDIPVSGLDTLTATHIGIHEPNAAQLVVHKAGQSGFYYFSDLSNSTNIKMGSIAEIIAGLSPTAITILGTGADDLTAASGREDLTRLSAHDFPDAKAIAIWAAGEVAPTTLPQPLYIRGADAKPQITVPQIPVIRVGKASLVRLAAIHQNAFEKPWDENQLDGLLALPGITALMAADKAFILYRLAADEAEILTLATEPSARHKGLASALVKATATRLRAEGAKSLFLEVATDNHGAQALYRKLGFKQAGRRRSYYERQEGPAIDADILRLALF
ncbi:MAG: tRNA (adenosine(37)-N6)-threonylcarbamoyltransferase complex dimerization subunit type 1 TsaB [Aestuariivirga sp.]